MRREIADAMLGLDMVISKSSRLKCPDGGAYAYEAGYRSSLMNSMSGISSSEGMLEFIKLETAWLEKQIKGLIT